MNNNENSEQIFTFDYNGKYMEIVPINTKKLPGNLVMPYEIKDPPPPEVKKKKWKA